jgi:hypothetical protein
MTDQHRHHLEIRGYNELLAEHCALTERVAALEARINDASLPAPVPGLWIETSEQLPPDDRNVLVFMNGYCSLYDDEARAGGWGIAIGWCQDGQWYPKQNRPVTHWQFLSSAPTAAARMERAEWDRLAHGH